ncbi:MAG: hypothetical protein H6747_05550 [Deltaproteobacteria bacterium]|nr:hypothetical protein [Deltaproteobacteria bacterium]
MGVARAAVVGEGCPGREATLLAGVQPCEQAADVEDPANAAALDYELPDLSVDGEGVSAEFRDGGWDTIAAAVWQGRGS